MKRFFRQTYTVFAAEALLMARGRIRYAISALQNSTGTTAGSAANAAKRFRTHIAGSVAMIA